MTFDFENIRMVHEFEKPIYRITISKDNVITEYIDYHTYIKSETKLNKI